MKNCLLFLILCLLSCQVLFAQQSASQQIARDFTDSLNQARERSKKVADGKIELSAGAETDFFIEPGAEVYEKANAPLLLKSIDNTRAFTFSVKTTPVHDVKYDAGMAFIFVDNKHWLKFAFEADEKMKNRIVTVKTKDFSDDNNHDVINSPSVYLKISSDTKAIGFYYSVDGRQWQLVRVFKNEYPPALKIGIGSQSPAGKGNKSLFEDFQFTQQSVKDFRTGI